MRQISTKGFFEDKTTDLSRTDFVYEKISNEKN